ncbi:MAG: thiamine-phosphate kinase [Gemmatimonadetes bacterium]|nr:thiamine-phosphate kinase [Gemmatimonadota bacterium]
MTSGSVRGLEPGPETTRIRSLLDEADAAAQRTITGAVGDDAATLEPPPGERLVVSTDASVEDVHFRREWMTWETIGYRAAASALSDLAAMAATPAGALVSAALPPELGPETTGAIGRGIGEALARAGASLLGGDLVASPGPVFLDVSALGFAREPLSRAGARPGDAVWVTGRLGGAASAVADLRSQLEPHPDARRAFERPRPRTEEARWLVERAELHAAIDLSDGLARDAAHLARASRVAIRLDAARCPAIAPLEAIRDTLAGLRLILAGGEDYELLVTAPPGSLESIAAEFTSWFELPLTRIGRVLEGRGLEIEGVRGNHALGGFDHFDASEPFGGGS